MSEPEFIGVHARFLADEKSEIDLEGARFSGKTWVCCAKIIRSCLKFPGIHWLACRYSNEETKNKVVPVFREMCARMCVAAEWIDKENNFVFPEVGGRISRVFCYGLKSVRREEELSKVRGLEMGGIWNDQSEETPEGTAQELPFGTRQPGFPHQLIFSPNPPTEDHFLTDMFPEECTPENEDRPFKHRNYYRLSLYDNAHNLPPGKIRELEEAFPPTHAKHRSLILGMRGPNVVGDAVYEHTFFREKDGQPWHVRPVDVDSDSDILEAIQAGRHHPVWVAFQRTHEGELHALGGIMGKKMFLEDFLPVIADYRQQWFEDHQSQLCCDAPPSLESNGRYTHLNVLRESHLFPTWRANSNAPDVRETMIQHNAGLMRRRQFAINADPTKWLMVSPTVTKRSRHFIDGCETSYVWDRNLVSVANKKMRQPQDDQWIDGWQRCFENVALNFCAGQATPAEIERRRLSQRQESAIPFPQGPQGWMSS